MPGFDVSPTDRELRKRGALLAAEISWVWLVAAVVGTVALVALGASYYALPLIIAIGAAAALPVSAAFGWRLAERTERQEWTWLLGAMLVVVFTDFEIAIVATVGVAVVATNPLAILIGPLGALYGLVMFGLPGLAMAVPSAWFWEHKMRQTPSQTAPQGGGQGSGGPLR